jgi:hypothetical protein
MKKLNRREFITKAAWAAGAALALSQLPKEFLPMLLSMIFLLDFNHGASKNTLGKDLQVH